MNRITLLIAVLSIAVLSALPAAANDNPVRLVPCAGDNVLTLDGLDTDLDMPLLAGDNITGYTLDLSGQESVDGVDHDSTARVSASLTWDIFVNDYDLTLGATTTEDFQPIDPAEEFAQETFNHCDIVSAGAINFSATGGDSLNLVLSVKL